MSKHEEPTSPLTSSEEKEKEQESLRQRVEQVLNKINASPEVKNKVLKDGTIKNVGVGRERKKGYAFLLTVTYEPEDKEDGVIETVTVSRNKDDELVVNNRINPVKGDERLRLLHGRSYGDIIESEPITTRHPRARHIVDYKHRF